jgi:Collagen triple helix repeat (20 copies)
MAHYKSIKKYGKSYDTNSHTDIIIDIVNERNRRGPQGKIGPRGIFGPQGIIGPSGQGIIGSQGPRGLAGIQGSIGPEGLQGLDGVQGAMGPQGSMGSQGNTGVQGSIGLQGSMGIQGLQGLDGVQGATGPQGSTGPQGNIGPQGSIGPQGNTGSQGPQFYNNYIFSYASVALTQTQASSTYIDVLFDTDGPMVGWTRVTTIPPFPTPATTVFTSPQQGIYNITYIVNVTFDGGRPPIFVTFQIITNGLDIINGSQSYTSLNETDSLDVSNTFLVALNKSETVQLQWAIGSNPGVAEALISPSSSGTEIPPASITIIQIA